MCVSCLKFYEQTKSHYIAGSQITFNQCDHGFFFNPKNPFKNCVSRRGVNFQGIRFLAVQDSSIGDLVTE